MRTSFFEFVNVSAMEFIDRSFDVASSQSCHLT